MSLPTQTRSWILTNRPSGLPTTSGSNPTFTLETRDLPKLEKDQVLVKSLYYSNDPAQRGWISGRVPAERLYVPPVNIGDPMRARGLGEVLESTSEKFKKGDYVLGGVNWNEYAVLDASQTQPADKELPGGLDVTHYLGALGSTGLTAYFGLTEVGRVQKGDRVVISGAAGATGSMAVQIAKNILGASHVVGIAGGDKKCKWVESLGADKCVDYKSPNFEKDLAEATKDGVNVYFDNVAGHILDAMLGRMSRYGRVICCGAINAYNRDDEDENAVELKNYFQIITMRLELNGFIVIDFLDKAPAAREVFKKALADGKLKIGKDNETVVDTKFDDVPNTWLKLFDGGNQGKLVTKIAN